MCNCDNTPKFIEVHGRLLGSLLSTDFIPMMIPVHTIIQIERPKSGFTAVSTFVANKVFAFEVSEPYDEIAAKIKGDLK